VHSGWGGDKVSGGGGGPVDVRLARDVVAYHPTVLTIMLGMNDGGYTNHKEANDTAYFDGYRHIVESMEKSVPGVRITAIGPSPYDDVTRPINLQPDGYNAVLVLRGLEFRRGGDVAKGQRDRPGGGAEDYSGSYPSRSGGASDYG
jgi:hypothetical protein